MKKKKPKPKTEKLKPTQMAFCHFYLFGSDEKGNVFRIGHGGKSYAMAYGKDYKKDRAVCDTGAYESLRKHEILKYMDSLLEGAGWNDRAIDSRLRSIALDGSDKNAVMAIKLYNELKSRMVKHIDVTTKGRPVQVTAIEQLTHEIHAEEETVENILDEIEETVKV